MVTGVYGRLVEPEREGTKMVRDSQKWKKVEIKDAQAVSQQDRSTYQNDPDVVAGMTQGTVQQVAVRAGQQEEGEGGQDQRKLDRLKNREGQVSIMTDWTSGQVSEDTRTSL